MANQFSVEMLFIVPEQSLKNSSFRLFYFNNRCSSQQPFLRKIYAVGQVEWSLKIRESEKRQSYLLWKECCTNGFEMPLFSFRQQEFLKRSTTSKTFELARYSLSLRIVTCYIGSSFWYQGSGFGFGFGISCKKYTDRPIFDNQGSILKINFGSGTENFYLKYNMGSRARSRRSHNPVAKL